MLSKVKDVTLSRLRHSTALTMNSESDTRINKLKSRLIRPAPLQSGIIPLRVDYSRGQSKIIDSLLNEMNNGFFIDIGAGNGEKNSVSFFFEKERKWDGVIIEAKEEMYQEALQKNRQCFLWNVKLMLGSEPPALSDAGITPKELFQIIDRTSIDLLIINLNGMEFGFLRSIEFDKYLIKAITIEMQYDASKELYFAITNFLAENQYKVAHHIIDSLVNKKDIIYLHRCVSDGSCLGTGKVFSFKTVPYYNGGG